MSDYKPITGELRKYATVSWDPWPDARVRLYQMCDRIDAIHAGLERENAELKAKLDRGTGEQEEHAHARSESITGELRDWYKDRIFMANGWQEINDIADRIDAEHERQLEVLYRDMNDAEYVKLPKDADGEYIHIGDVMDSKVDYLFDGKPFTVRGLMLCEYGWEAADGRFGNRYDIDLLHHHHAPTVEDMLREFALAVCKDDALTIREGVVEEFAKRLTLAEGEDA